MSADPSDITARTLLKGFLAAEAPKSTVKHKPKRRASELERLSLQNQFSTSRNVSSWLSPSIKLREKMKENIVCPVNKVTSKRLLEKHRLGRGVLLSQNDLDKDTPRTILKKIIQTESEVSMLVIEKPQVGRHEQIEEEPAVKNTLLGLDKLEMNMLEPPSQRAATGLSRTRKKKKRVSVSQFERGVEETLPQIKERKERLEEHREHMALANISAMSRSFKMPLSTPSVPESIEKKGLVRRPKKHRFISVEDFEEGINQNLMHLKGSQDCFVESMMTNANGSMFPSSALQMNTEIILSNTELFVKSQPKEQTLKELSQPMSPSILSISKLSLIKSGHIGNRDMASLNDLGPEIRIQLELNAKNKAFQMKGVEEENKRESYPITVAEKELLIEEVEKENESCSVMDVENEEGLMTEREEKSYSAENTETDMPLTKGVEENIEQMDRMTSAIENGTESSQSSRSFGKSLQGTSKLVNSVFESSEEPIDLNHHAQVIFPLLLKQASGTFISNTAESVVPRSEVRAETEESNISPVNDRWQEEEEFETEQITKNEESGTRASQISVISMKTEPLNTSKHSGHNSTPYSLKTFMNPVSPCTRSTGKDGAGSDQNDDMSYDEEEDEEAECEEPSMDKMRS
ncbi:centromere protein T [Rhinatrema bivittatum]|uniref:centromere protein T n=1 Tax=Rhinatrema bivittatum TaxID=194408 RepID=UPI00112E875D|nr:centromere protein T [Rhinatrema bivittatum]